MSKHNRERRQHSTPTANTGSLDNAALLHKHFGIDDKLTPEEFLLKAIGSPLEDMFAQHAMNIHFERQVSKEGYRVKFISDDIAEVWKPGMSKPLRAKVASAERAKDEYGVDVEKDGRPNLSDMHHE